MELNQAKEILSQALDVAMKKGCYGLSDNLQIVQALQKINELDDVKFGKITQVDPPKK